MTPRLAASTPTPELIDKALPIFDPAYAFIVHSRRDAHANGSHASRTAIMTLHSVVGRPNQAPQIGPGTIMGADDIDVLLARLGGDFTRDSARRIELLPWNVLSVEPQGVTWFVPGERRLMHYRTSSGKAEHLDVVWPHLVFRAYKGNLHVAAVARAERPELQTPLFHAPLANVDAEGSVCTGSATLPRSTELSTMRDWEGVIYRTYFTHQNHPNALRGGTTSDSLRGYWKDRQKHRTPPAVKQLNPMRYSLGAWLDAIVRRDDR